MRFEHHQTRNPNSIFLRKLSVVGHNWKWIKQGFNLQRQECSNLTEHVPNSPGVRPVFRQNQPCLWPNFGSATRRRLASSWVGWVGARFRRSWCVQGGEAKEEMKNRGKQSMNGKKKKEERKRARRVHACVLTKLAPLSFFLGVVKR